MLDVFNIAKPQNCDIQTFYGRANANVTTTNPRGMQTWNKPRGVSNVYMMLIGGGGAGNGSAGGGSGAVTVWYGSAINVPDSLLIYVPNIGFTGHTYIWTQSSMGAFSASTALLTAQTASTSTGGAATTANQFAASGFYQSIAGQNGAVGDPGASATTFLSGGAGGTGTPVTANYGYQATDPTSSGNVDGYFQLQPIIVGVGSGGTKASVPYPNGNIGCGGGRSAFGGPGFVLIASW